MTFVAVFRALISAPATTAPLLSVITPLSSALDDCACIRRPAMKSMAIAIRPTSAVPLHWVVFTFLASTTAGAHNGDTSGSCILSHSIHRPHIKRQSMQIGDISFVLLLPAGVCDVPA